MADHVGCKACLLAHLLYLLPNLLAGVLDLFLTSQEHQDVTGGLTHMDLHDGPDGCFQIVSFRLLQGTCHTLKLLHSIVEAGRLCCLTGSACVLPQSSVTKLAVSTCQEATVFQKPAATCRDIGGHSCATPPTDETTNRVKPDLSVEDLHRVQTPGHLHQGCIQEVALELLCFQSGAHDNQLHVGPLLQHLPTMYHSQQRCSSKTRGLTPLRVTFPDCCS